MTRRPHKVHVLQRCTFPVGKREMVTRESFPREIGVGKFGKKLAYFSPKFRYFWLFFARIPKILAIFRQYSEFLAILPKMPLLLQTQSETECCRELSNIGYIRLIAKFQIAEDASYTLCSLLVITTKIFQINYIFTVNIGIIKMSVNM